MAGNSRNRASKLAQERGFSTDNRRWMASLNRLSLNAFLPWLQEEYAPNATVFPNLAVLPSIWEVVNGTAIDCGECGLVLIPTEAIDLSELRVPQEWVDIPSWSARLLSRGASQFRRGLYSSLGIYYPGATQESPELMMNAIALIAWMERI